MKPDARFIHHSKFSFETGQCLRVVGEPDSRRGFPFFLKSAVWSNMTWYVVTLPLDNSYMTACIGPKFGMDLGRICKNYHTKYFCNPSITKQVINHQTDSLGTVRFHCEME